MSDAYIYDAVRTPRGKVKPASAGKARSTLSAIMPHELVGQLVDALRSRNGDDVMGAVARLILGCVGQVDTQGGHIALVSRLAANLSDTVAVKTINNYCASGLTAINESALWARAGEPGLSLAGGIEMLSQVPFLADRGTYYNEPVLIQDLRWALPVMGAELIATLEGYTKAELDELSLLSHQRAAAAWECGYYDRSVIPVRSSDGTVMLTRDEWIRSDWTLETLARFRPAFAEAGALGADDMMLRHNPDLDAITHVHSMANAPGLADGAALVLSGSKIAGEQVGLQPRARVVAIAEVGGDPVIQFMAGFAAMEEVLARSGIGIDELDLIEFMEAFAAVPLKFLRDYRPEFDKVNVNGGHLAMGHPMGATGAILVTTLLDELERRGGTLGMVVALAAGGIGSAMIIERV